jgi:hypothetical protein
MEMLANSVGTPEEEQKRVVDGHPRCSFPSSFPDCWRGAENYSEFCKPLNEALLRLAKSKFAEGIKIRPSFRIMNEDILKMKKDMRSLRRWPTNSRGITLDFEYDQLRLKGLAGFPSEIGATDLSGKAILAGIIDYRVENREAVCRVMP